MDGVSKRSKRGWWFWSVTIVGGASIALLIQPRLREPSLWQGLANPGELSSAHASLVGDCAACHSPIEGPVAAKCILCHANNQRLLQRQPTAFHGSVSSCRECHPEHRGRSAQTTTMDHEALASIGLREIEARDEPESRQLAQFVGALSTSPSGRWHLKVTPAEAALDCNVCHATADPHVGLFGANCVECHATAAWAISEFRHPSSRSRECASCHQAPPSHYMMHFKMISATIARKPHADVRQCFECHRTTSWNDIPGIGRYKHH